MRAFRRVPEGLAYGLNNWEREPLARLALGMRVLPRADTPQGAGQSETSSPSRPDPVRPGESERDRKVLEALDLDLDAPTNHVRPGRPSTDPIIAVLLPQVSEDPITLMEISSLARTHLRGDKVDRLACLIAELRAPSGPKGAVFVTPDQESDWLGASNDIRLVLIQCLDIKLAQDAERVHAAAFQKAPEEETPREQWCRGTALVYDMVTWWQESLVSALFGDTGPTQSRGVDNAPIGMSDSGVDGLAIARLVLDQLLRKWVLHIGDAANGPYGPRNIVKVRSLTLGIMNELVDRGVKLLVITCNTASAAVLRDAQERCTLGRGVPVIEVIHPTACTATRVTHNGKVGLIVTHGTANPRIYDDALQAVPGVKLVSQACPRFVELAERGVTTGLGAPDIAREYLAPIKAASVDTLILGYIHYLLLVGPISYVMRRGVTLVTSLDETARDVYRALAGKNLLHGPEAPKPRHDFVFTGDPGTFSVLTRRFLGPKVTAVEHVAFTPGAADAPAGLPHPPSPPIFHQGST